MCGGGGGGVGRGGEAVSSADFPAVYSPVLNLICYYNK